MDTIAPATPALPAELRHRRVRLELGPAAAAYACGHVRAAIAAWSVPVNPAVAILLTSDLVINAVTNGAGETDHARHQVVVGPVPGRGPRRVGDRVTPGRTPTPTPTPMRGLLLAAAMAVDWGHYRTPAGRAVYYVLAPEPQASPTPRGALPRHPWVRPRIAPREAASGGGEP